MNGNKFKARKTFINWFVFVFVYTHTHSATICIFYLCYDSNKGIKRKKKCRKFSFKLFENKTTIHQLHHFLFIKVRKEQKKIICFTLYMLLSRITYNYSIESSFLFHIYIHFYAKLLKMT